MIRRNFIKGLPLIASAGLGNFENVLSKDEPSDRAYWLEKLLQVGGPVIRAVANNKLKATMPVEAQSEALSGRREVTHLEAFGRTLAGMAPWLESEINGGAEGKLQKEYFELCIRALKNATDPAAADYMNFSNGTQPLVDAAFLAHGLLRAPRLWSALASDTRDNLVRELKATRVIKPYYSNWLLFSAMIEAALLKFTDEYDPMRADYALKSMESWYKGDGVYGDGPDFHFDYYNSFVIHPMLLDIVRTIHAYNGSLEKERAVIQQRATRYTDIMERLISPEGTFPPVGRSLAYRCGAFQLLAQMALQKTLPVGLPPGQVRSALTAVIRKTLDAPETFDTQGWLTIGFVGHQPAIGESYISTGSLYLCTAAFLPLGLPATDEFWTSPAQEWTSKKAFSGKVFPIDKAL
jgi:hypothetical protein